MLFAMERDSTSGSKNCSTTHVFKSSTSLGHLSIRMMRKRHAWSLRGLTAGSTSACLSVTSSFESGAENRKHAHYEGASDVVFLVIDGKTRHLSDSSSHSGDKIGEHMVMDELPVVNSLFIPERSTVHEKDHTFVIL